MKYRPRIFWYRVIDSTMNGPYQDQPADYEWASLSAHLGYLLMGLKFSRLNVLPKMVKRDDQKY